MKTKSIIVAIILIISIVGCNAQNTLNKTNLYFGQKPPGHKAIAFAADLLTFEPHDSPIFSQDETIMIIGTMEQGVKFYQMINGLFSLSTNPLNFDFPFSDNPYSYNGMEISRSKTKIYFLVWKNNKESFYSIEKQKNGWTSPKLLGKGLDVINTHWQFTVATNENLYLMVRGKGVCVSVFDGISHLKPVQLILEDGSNMDGGTPFIAGDESYIIYSLDNNLHISYNLNNGKWTIPQKLSSDINSDRLDLCPRISPNGKYLFFISKRNGPNLEIYWVEAGFIEELKPKNLK